MVNQMIHFMFSKSIQMSSIWSTANCIYIFNECELSECEWMENTIRSLWVLIIGALTSCWLFTVFFSLRHCGCCKLLPFHTHFAVDVRSLPLLCLMNNFFPFWPQNDVANEKLNVRTNVTTNSAKLNSKLIILRRMKFIAFEIKGKQNNKTIKTMDRNAILVSHFFHEFIFFNIISHLIWSQVGNDGALRIANITFIVIFIINSGITRAPRVSKVSSFERIQD